MAKTFNLYTCADAPGIKSVTVEGGNTLVVTELNGGRHSVTLPTQTDNVVTGASIAGNTITLTRKSGEPVTLDLSTVLNTINGKQVGEFSIAGNTITLSLADGTRKDVTLPQDSKGVVSGRLSGSNLELLGENGSAISTINIGSIIPAAAADRYLKNVAYAGGKLKFTVGENGETTRDQVLDITVSDFLVDMNATDTKAGLVKLYSTSNTNGVVTKSNLTEAIDAAKREVEEAIAAKPCLIPITNQTGDYTLQATDKFVVHSGGTITVPVLPVGSQVTIVQATATEVVLQAGGSVKLVQSTLNGGLKLGGENAAATLVVTAENTVRLFGHLQE